jgi:hypothetical protein
MQRTIELSTAAAAVLLIGCSLAINGTVEWPVVACFGALVVLAENTQVMFHTGASVSPATGAVLVGACGGLYMPHFRDRRWSILAFNCGQYALASLAAGVVYDAFSAPKGAIHVAAAMSAAIAFAAVNVGLVLPHVAIKLRERPRTVWADMYPALPNYLAWGLLGLLVGLVCAELGALAIVLLAIPMGIGRWTFRSFTRVRDAHDASVRLFIRLIEAKDPYTAGHTERVAKYSLYIGEKLDLSTARLEHLRQSALMHDVGKLAVPSRLLNKPGKLTPEEWEIVKCHNTAGIGILTRVDFMRTMAVTASDQHGRFDHGEGSTVPPELILEAHIVAVADAFDAMTSTRAYRKALSQAVAFGELRDNAGTQFNPICVDALIDSIAERGEQYGAGYEQHVHEWAVPPPVAGLGSAGLGDLEEAPGA